MMYQAPGKPQQPPSPFAMPAAPQRPPYRNVADTVGAAADLFRNPPAPQDPYAGMPQMPTSVLGGVNRDTSGLNAYAAEAMRQGPSKWAGLAQQQNDLSAGRARQEGTLGAEARTQQGMDQLAMQGGLGAGAAERMQQAGARNALAMGQDVGRDQQERALDISKTDEQNRLTQLGNLPGMQLAGGQFDLAKANAENEFRRYLYETQGNIWGAGKQADAESTTNPNSPNYDDKKRWYNPASWF